MKKIAAVSAMMLAMLFFASPTCLAKYDSQKAGFSVAFLDEVCPYKVLGVFVLPGASLDIQESRKKAITCESLTGEGALIQPSKHSWTFQAPSRTGLYPLQITHKKTGKQMTLNLFVMEPYSSLKGGYLNGYLIGRYPDPNAKNNEIYAFPEGFVEVTPENGQTLVSPHFRLEQFLCKQEGGFPKYIVLRERLLLKLEALLEVVNHRGIKASTFQVMSGYRTPEYNRSMGNVPYSRHLWGGAADIFIDEKPVDNKMDDLNKDGKINYKDASVLFGIIDSLQDETWYAPFVGGLGWYRKSAFHGPYIHVDVRGYKTRWGG